MPELPDVETFRRFLHRTAGWHTIESIEVRDEWILRGLSGRTFRSHAESKKLTSTWRHGKYLFAALHPHGFLVFHSE
jgi:formamidopyrimidine-DNA glycosylase